MANEKPQFFRREKRANQSAGKHIFILPAFPYVSSFTRLLALILLTDMLKSCGRLYRTKLPVTSGPDECESEMEAVGKTIETESSSTDDDSLSILSQSMSSHSVSLKRKLPDEREMKSARQNPPPPLQSHQLSVSTDDSKSVSG